MPATRRFPTDGADQHEHDAPHGGALVELGDEFAHLEVVIDPDHGVITVYVLDGEAEQSVRISQATLRLVVDSSAALVNRPLELVPRASALTGERVGDASEFTLATEALRGVRRLSGRVMEVIARGQTFRDVVFTAEPAAASARGAR